MGRTHFEKMLYDNGQLVDIYLHAFQVTGSPLYEATIVKPVITYYTQ